MTESNPTREQKVELWLRRISEYKGKCNGAGYGYLAGEMIEEIEASGISDEALNTELFQLKNALARSHIETGISIYGRSGLNIIEYLEREVKEAKESGYEVLDFEAEMREIKDPVLKKCFEEILNELREKTFTWFYLLTAKKMYEKIKDEGFSFPELEKEYIKLRDKIEKEEEAHKDKT